MWYRKIILCLILIVAAGCTKSNSPQVERIISSVLDNNNTNMVFVKGGTFIVGDSGDGKDLQYLTNISEVQETKEIKLSDFYINKYEVTWFEYIAYLKDEELFDYDSNQSSRYFGIKSDEDILSPNYHLRPAMAESWESAKEYCNWLGFKTGDSYALPTEAQWEYAARSRGKKVFHAGELNAHLKLDNYMRGEYIVKDPKTKKPELIDASDPLAPVNGNALGEFQSNYKRIVGSYPANGLGLHDMVGNAQEWVSDWYEIGYYPKMNTINPTGPEKAVVWAKFRERDSVPKKVVRDWLYGGSVIQHGEVYARGGKPIINSNTGFRCVKNILNEL